MMDGTPQLLKIRDLRINFDTVHGLVKAVDGVDLDVFQGECLGVVGESGSGKSVTFKSVAGLIRKPGRIASGRIEFNGIELTQASERQLRKLRGKEIALTLQDALTALNPSIKVGEQIREVLKIHDRSLFQKGKKAVQDYIVEMMRMVGIPDSESRLDDYPHQFSGGMRQRIMIAIALSCKPKLLIADEPTTALDVTIQAQVLSLIADLRKKLDMAVVIITHDLGVVAEYTDRVAVMYAGQIVETGNTKDIIRSPEHPYTRGLLRSIPDLSNLDQAIHPIPGQIPDVSNLPQYCRFYPRCEQATDQCRQIVELRSLSPQRKSRCLFSSLSPEKS
ncbi:MAG: ABC transporter ATP-binding protein [SAR324 cluster bacterium]|nr:ABC transporter ATP-binding protein [SAR324 cluster bacterium]